MLKDVLCEASIRDCSSRKLGGPIAAYYSYFVRVRGYQSLSVLRLLS